MTLMLGAPAFSFAADEGAKIVDEVCSACHNPSVRPIEQMHLTRAQWAAAIERMTGMGAEVPKKKIPELLDYLVRTQGPSDGTTPGSAGDAAKK